MTATVEQEKTDLIKVSDRCDRCQSQALVWVNGIAGDLYFCRHHFLKHEESIRQYAFEVIDETYKLNN